jgi:3-oxoacyl-[acyl-carrier protein] reductase
VDFAEFEASLVAGIPVGRAGTPEDVAAAAEFLTGADAGFVSGQVLYVAGGERT